MMAPWLTHFLPNMALPWGLASLCGCSLLSSGFGLIAVFDKSCR